MLIFCSYARSNRSDAQELAALLRPLEHQVWFDDSLHGGDDWWATIIGKIETCDAFLAVISRASINSVACQRELHWALALGKPVVPVAVERLTEALPRELSVRHIIDFSERSAQATMALAAAVSTLPPAPAVPDPRPEPPPAPLSYLTDLTDLVASPAWSLDHEQQGRILDQLQPALRSSDTEEHDGAVAILDSFSRRGDLYADVRDRANGLLPVGVAAASAGVSSSPPPSAGPVPVTGQSAQPQLASTPSPPLPTVVAKKRSKAVTVLAVIGALFVALVLLALISVEDDPVCGYDSYGQYYCE
jgi:hypothetical protein